ncbi:hypothetical protein diail_765 [Diaporthe ilicicola]|nr:hypothetical protein diail_765 [Diaporthe ilicicola]
MIFRFSIFHALAIFSLNVSAYYLGQWGLENFAIACPNDDSCTYNFRITRGIGTPDQFYRHTDCNFTINRYLDIPAAQVDLCNQPCGGTDDRDDFRIDGRWDSHGFVNFCIIHEVSDSWSYFAYETSQVLNSNASYMSISPCYQIGTFNKTDRPPGYGTRRTELIDEAESEADMPVADADAVDGDRKKARMRIGCLQFAPQVGDVDNNLNRADSVLSKADPDDLDSLDLLVVPEMAFSGYNFTSLAHISPYLEYCGSGVSSLWARTLALKHNCHVVCGYPEKVDVSDRWPTSPEYYNSAIIVSNEGETIGNYRKHFLYMIDETWALEGSGFGKDEIPGLGQTAMGICMDINPYKFEAPWHAFEFAFHVLEVRANLVILSMAWLTREDAGTFTSTPNEPDMETLAYWVQRMEPLIRAETTEEIIVVFSNRCGMEDDTVYAGSSAVIGIKGGEVNVYGILSRCEKSLLVVDTDSKPLGKLVNRPDQDVESETPPPGEPAGPMDPGNRASLDDPSRLI